MARSEENTNQRYRITIFDLLATTAAVAISLALYRQNFPLPAVLGTLGFPATIGGLIGKALGGTFGTVVGVVVGVILFLLCFSLAAELFGLGRSMDFIGLEGPRLRDTR